MVNIPPFDATYQYQTIASEIEKNICAVMAGGRYILGPQVKEFEAEFAQYLGCEQVISCNSGTDALHLALRALRIGPGDEVITTPFTFVATTEAIGIVGATPVFVDVDVNTYNIDPSLIEEKITERTKAILPVHLFGRPCNMTDIMAIARKYNLKVIEDCAQSTGATWQGKKVGVIGDVGCFSFFPTKNLGCFGDGGAIATCDPEIAERVEYLRRHGGKVKYQHEELGLNSRLDTLQAAVLLVKLPYVEQWNSARSAIANYYISQLAEVESIVLPTVQQEGESVWNQFTIKVLDGQRERLQKFLKEKGVGSMIYYPIPLHLQQVHADLGYFLGSLPNSERLSHEVLSLPMFPELTVSAQQVVTESISQAFSSFALT
ncbi:DegT/DnrJ/EryC1/StrS family aminotransferase [Aetokthonos hydrillicola Thurmond2011]|uniref:DegT/DnrJ/EryC1/StrS family aminotransferase n=1 Tax=Aetokthonos hydrillicola Thurmond2011 TaxID=2712845 RepID=A0AAP5I8U3_9CYAN|nr:DegT/DnrJ/EryC1/StrS family aminotransferase [Aetokthonos hydrillicola]MBO3462941.1 DegT/DnrJ/EryC1/StrS family aminotransferase [Aetokthonos hydrillicola CCALA 1050]MBW4585685.1 DegT/DnrJ/EryC1/StrS family aminotransferase [Aetokthonos hydrillicola CCALA 1050]MDR9894585.1 DegT/DnrJ/EryC1/StrS family aminotransferase [Aetokthonos hydrillicola Thurmond2011]